MQRIYLDAGDSKIEMDNEVAHLTTQTKPQFKHNEKVAEK